MTYWLGKYFAKIFIYFPVRLQKWLADFIGWVAWVLLSPRKKKKMVEDIIVSLAVSSPEAKIIAKASVTRYGRMLATLFHYPTFTPELINKLVRFHGLEYLDQALAHKKGVVLAAGHFGNWELLGYALTVLGYPMVGVIRPQKNHGFNALIHEYRSMGNAVILTKNDVRSIVRQLKDNRIPYILIDQDARDTGIFVKFFGRWASTPPGAAVLARMSGAPIVAAYITESADGTHDLFFSEPIFVTNEGNKNETINNVMQRLTWQMEEQVRQHPDEWFWMQDRWRTKKSEAEQTSL